MCYYHVLVSCAFIMCYYHMLVSYACIMCWYHVLVSCAGMCPTTWDGVMCWPQSHANSVVSQPCPYYINNFFVDGQYQYFGAILIIKYHNLIGVSMSRVAANASRVCEADGSWLVANNISHGWTNYTQCYSHDNDSQTIPTVSPLIGV